MNRISACLFLSLPVFLLFTSNSVKANPPNIVFILADDLGWTDLNCRDVYSQIDSKFSTNKPNTIAEQYDSTVYYTPNLMRLRKMGMRFTNAYAASTICSPTRAAIQTGKYPAHVRTLWLPDRTPPAVNLQPPISRSLTTWSRTIPQALNTCLDPDYDTGYHGKWHLTERGNVIRYDAFESHPEQRGYSQVTAGRHSLAHGSYFYSRSVTGGVCDPGNGDYKFNAYCNASCASTGIMNSQWLGYLLPDGCNNIEVDGVPNNDMPDYNPNSTDPNFYLTNYLSSKGKDFLHTPRQAPFLLFQSHYAVHDSVNGTKIEARQDDLDYLEDNWWNGTGTAPGSTTKPAHNNKAYAGALKSLDDAVGAILDDLTALGKLNNTIIIFTSDNGGSEKSVSQYNEDGLINGSSNVQQTDNFPLTFGKTSIFEGGHRVPLIIAWPDGGIPANETCDVPVHSIDFLPTLLDLAGVSPSHLNLFIAQNNIDGVSLKPLLLPDCGQGFSRPDNALFWHFPVYHSRYQNEETPRGVVRMGDYKLIKFYEDEVFTQHRFLYDLKDDLSETDNLADPTHPDFAKHRELADHMERKLNAHLADIGAPMPKGVWNKGKSWHYTLDAAVSAAVDNDTLIVYRGVYSESVEIDKNGITLRSVDPSDPAVVSTTVIEGDGTQPAITVASGVSGVTTVGMTVGCASIDLESDLQAHWKLDEDTGTTAADSASNHNGNLENFSANPWIATGGKLNGALAFDGNNDYIKVDSYKGVAGTQDRTVAAWINIGDDGGGTILSWGGNPDGDKHNWVFRCDSSNGVIEVEVNGQTISGYTSVKNDWHHVAAVLPSDGTPQVKDIRLYVDGQFETTKSLSTESISTAPQENVHLGVDWNSSLSDYFKGSMDDVRIYDRALNFCEIRKLAEYDPPPPPSVDDITSNLVAHWKLDEGTGTATGDASSSNNNGELKTDGTGLPIWQTGGGFDGCGYLTLDTSKMQYIEIPSYTGITGGSSRTVSAWVRGTALNGIVIGWGKSEDGKKWVLRIENGIARQEVHTGFVKGTTDISDGKWHHIAAVLVDDGDPRVEEVQMYIDGVPESFGLTLSQIVDTTAASNVMLGKHPVQLAYFNGDLDDVRIYERALTQVQVKYLFEETRNTHSNSGIEGNGTATIVRNCVIKNNSSNTGGGGINNLGSSSSMGRIENCLIINNVNYSHSIGGAALANCDAEIINCTIVDNTSSGGSFNSVIEACTGSLANSIVWSNTPTTFGNIGTQLDVSFSNIQGSGGSASWDTTYGDDGGSNIDIDTKFTDSTDGDYSLQPDSPGIDTGGSIAPEEVADGLQGHWKLDESSGSIASDSVISGNNGTVKNDPQWTTGKKDGALALGGINESVVISGYNGVTGTTARTVAAWVKTDRIHTGTIVDWGEQQSGQDWHFQVQDWIARVIDPAVPSGTLQVGVWQGRVIGTTNICDGEWHHVAAVLAPTDPNDPKISDVTLYVDGVAEPVSHILDLSINTSPSSTVRIGAKETGVHFDGTVDDVRIYDVALDACEISQLATDAGNITTNLQAHWKLDETSTFTVSDSAGSHTGTVTGFTSWTQGIVGNAIQLDGVNDYIDVSSYSGVTGKTPRTVAAWIKTDKIHTGAIVDWGEQQSGQDWHLQVQDQRNDPDVPKGSLQVGVWGGLVLGTTNVCDGTWHHVAAVLDPAVSNDPKPSDVTLYVDGQMEHPVRVLDHSIDTSALSHVRLGAREDGRHFDGILDDVRIYDRALTASEIISLMGYPKEVSGNPRVLGDQIDMGAYEFQPILHQWNFNELAGDMVIDNVGTANGALLNFDTSTCSTGDCPWTDDSARGCVLQFDGNDDLVSVGPLDVQGGTMSISAWLKADSFSTSDGRIISKATGTAEQDHYWMLSTITQGNDRRLRFRLRTTDGGITTTSTLIASSGNLSVDTWTHVIAVYDGSSMILYKDGELVGSQAKSGMIAANAAVDVSIGNQPVGAGNQPFDGMMDDIRIYSTALSPQQVKMSYQPQSAPISSCVYPDLIAHWKLNETSGSTASDVTGSHSGNLINFPADPWISNGKVNGALDFDGTDDRLDAGIIEVGGSAITLAAWFNADSFTTSDGRIISRASGTAEQDHYWMLSTILQGNDHRLRFRLRSNDCGITTTSTLTATGGNLATGVWTHAAAVYNGSTMKLYKDGLEVGSMAKNGTLISSTSVGVGIGNQPVGDGNRPFDGILDEVMVFDRALSQSEIQDLVDRRGNALHYKVLLLAGQCNMNGYMTVSTGLPVELQSEQTDVLFYAPEHLSGLVNLRPYPDPSNASQNLFGPEILLGRTLADANPHCNFYLIKYAVDETSLHTDWDPQGTSNNYDTLLTTIFDGLTTLTNAGHTYDISAFFWMQGEKDAQDNQGNTYEANLKDFIASVRSEYDTNLPFIFGQLSKNQTDLANDHLDEVRTAQAAVDASINNVEIIVTNNMSLQSDNLHFDADGQIDLGKAFAKTYQKFYP